MAIVWKFISWLFGWSKPFYEQPKFINWVNNSKVLFTLRGNTSVKVNLSVYFKTLCESGNVDGAKNFIKSGNTPILTRVDSTEATDVINVANSHFYMTIDLTPPLKAHIDGEGDVHADLPIYYFGWFLSDSDQRMVHKVGRHFLQCLLGLEEVREQLLQEAGTSSIDEHWPQQPQRLHTTARYFGRSEVDTAYEARARPAVGTVTSLVVNGLLLTPRTFSGHVLLEKADRSLFEDPSMADLKAHVTLAVAGTTKPVQAGPDQVEVQNLIKEGVSPKATYPTALGKVADFGHGRFYVTLINPLSIPAIFNIYY